MPGGGPQGIFLGLILFPVLIKNAEFKNECESLGIKMTKALKKGLNWIHCKYVNDFTMAYDIHLKSNLTNDDEETLEKPLAYHSRTNQILSA